MSVKCFSTRFESVSTALRRSLALRLLAAFLAEDLVYAACRPTSDAGVVRSSCSKPVKKSCVDHECACVNRKLFRTRSFAKGLRRTKRMYKLRFSS